MFRYCAIIFTLGLVISTCLADEDEKVSMDDVKKKLEDAASDSMKGMDNWFKSAAGEVKEKADSGLETMKDFSEQVKEKSESGIEAAKGFAGGIGERFSSVKEKIGETGEKMKGAITDAASKSKDEFESAASKISKHAKEASASMFSLFKFR